jgi:hypothetical protein
MKILSQEDEVDCRWDNFCNSISNNFLKNESHSNSFTTFKVLMKQVRIRTFV